MLREKEDKKGRETSRKKSVGGGGVSGGGKMEGDWNVMGCYTGTKIVESESMSVFCTTLKTWVQPSL